MSAPVEHIQNVPHSMKFHITNQAVREELGCSSPEMPKYVNPLLNMANQFAQATRPKYVGQQSELVQLFEGNSLEEWEQFYRQRHPEAISDAAKRLYGMIEQMFEAMSQITPEMVEKWVTDLVVTKSYVGLKTQELLLSETAKRLGRPWRGSTPQEESIGVDGYIGEHPISVKPTSYRTTRVARHEAIKADFLFYEKTPRGIEVEFNKAR